MKFSQLAGRVQWLHILLHRLILLELRDQIRNAVILAGDRKTSADSCRINQLFPEWFVGGAEKGRVDWEFCEAEGGNRTSTQCVDITGPLRVYFPECLGNGKISLGGVGVCDGCQAS